VSSADSNNVRLAVLLSGEGSTYAAIQTAFEQGQLAAQPVLVLSDRPGAGGLKKADRHGVEAVARRPKNYPERRAHEQAMAEVIDAVSPDWVILAGYMRILGAEFVQRYQGRMLNTHPSLLPAYRGLNTYQRALEAGETWHGCSIHFVTEDLDGGPVIAQAEVPVQAGDDAAELERRTRARERMLYPMIIDMAASGRLTMQNGQVLLDGHILTAPLRLPWDKEQLA